MIPIQNIQVGIFIAGILASILVLFQPSQIPNSSSSQWEYVHNPVVCQSQAPLPGLTVKGTVVNVVDGDTVDIITTHTVRIRFIDCWAPEKKKDHRLPEEEKQLEKEKGLLSKKNLESLAFNQEVIVSIPFPEAGSILSLGRVLGHVWLTSDQTESLGEKQVKAGYAEVSKPDKLK